MATVSCPVCEAGVDVPDDALEGELFECDACGAHLEFYLDAGNPKLKLAEEVSEDWGE